LKFEGKEPLYTRVEELYQDTQDIADILLDAEVKLGEMLEKLEKPKFDKQLNGSQRGTTGTLPSGVTKKQSHEAQEIARHPEAVEEVIYLGNQKAEFL